MATEGHPLTVIWTGTSRSPLQTFPDFTQTVSQE